MTLLQLQYEKEIAEFLGTRGASLKSESREAYRNSLVICFAALGISTIVDFQLLMMSTMRDNIDAEYRSKTREHALRVFRIFIKYANHKKWTDIPPEMIIVKKGIARLRMPPTKEEAEKIFVQISPTIHDTGLTKTIKLRDLLAVRILYETGVRVGELLSIAMSDIQHTEINLSDLAPVRIKTEKAETWRTVFWSGYTQKVLADYIALRNFFDPIGKGEMLFVSFGRDGSTSEHLTARSIQRTLAVACEEVDIRRITPHYFRHGFIQNLVDRGMPLTGVIQLSGHSNIESLQHYTRMDVSRQESFAKTYLRVAPALVKSPFVTT